MQLEPGATIGIIGGGQLGRMMAMAAAHMGFLTHIYTPDTDSPAEQVAAHCTVAAYDDAAALEQFAKTVDVITYEFENVPHESLAVLENTTQVRPSAQILRLTRNRITEKQAVNDCGFKTAPYKPVTSYESLVDAVKELGCPSILKTAELGYDGKGQARIEKDTDLQATWDRLKTDEAVLEGFVQFSKEVSVIVARNNDGDIACYPPVHNIHENHILKYTHVPASLDAKMTAEAEHIAHTLAERLGLVGLLAVELFVAESGELLVNELAPRPHNSGHWSMDACATSQFEQAIRAICNWQLGDTTPLCPAEMVNLIGDDVFDWKAYAARADAHVHLYNKGQQRPGRKMGHVNILKPVKSS